MMKKFTFFALLGALAFSTACGDDDTPVEDAGTDTAPEVDADTEDSDVGEDADTPDTDPVPDGAMFACDYPAGPYGTSVSHPFEPFTLTQCDGSDYDFVNEEFCSSDHKLTLISIAAGWCGPCIEESRVLESNITQRFADDGVRVIQVIIQDQNFAAPTTDYCQTWVDRFGLTNVELIDPAQITNVFFPDGSLPSSIIVDRNGIIRYRENGATDQLVSLVTKIEELLPTIE